jgi:hypothetical protein
MSNGIVVHLDNDREKVLNPSKNYFDQLNLDLEYICCSNVGEFKEVVQNKYDLVKALIFDLIGEKDTDKELRDHQSEFGKEIEEQFKNLRVPIFIYSGFLPKYDKFKYNGTVFKIDKDKGIEPVAKKIKLFLDSGFLDVFCANGVIERFLMNDLHESFITQFQTDSDIENIINSLHEAKVDVPQRTKEIFSRIAVRSLMSSLMIQKEVEADMFNESLISAVEHYIRRTNMNNIPVWTGDIFASKTTGDMVFILTPRCDVATKGKEDLLVCVISKTEDWTSGNVSDFVNDNIKFKKFRYLPKTPIFNGGKVDLSQQLIINKSSLKKDFVYVISLSEDLANEIIGKYCAYMLRTSVPSVDKKEIAAFLK